MKTETIAGITYTKPQVVLLQETGIGTAEIAARTCYDSFDASENSSVQILNKEFNALVEEPTAMNQILENINETPHSDLLDTLAWTHFHHSILEHANLTYLIKGTSRGVLQEHARHRIQSISVRSTRYTMSGIINAFVASQSSSEPRMWFANTLLTFDMFVTSDVLYNRIEIDGIYSKLYHQLNVLGIKEFNKLAVARSSLVYLDPTTPDPNFLYKVLQAGKKKRNVGDNFKQIVGDTWKVDMVVTFNLRSLKNYFTLRDSGAAYFQIRWLAQEMMRVTPSKYLDLIVKKK